MQLIKKARNYTDNHRFCVAEQFSGWEFIVV